MRFTKFERDWLIVNEDNYNDLYEINKVHLIKFNFDQPTADKVADVIDRFPNTKRFIINRDVRFYNNILKNLRKYYVENVKGTPLVTFLRKNNKILLNFDHLNTIERTFIYHNIIDVLRNVEVVQVGDIDSLPENVWDALEKWNGNVLTK